MSDDPYVYPGTTILRNKPGIRDAAQLDAFERHVTTQRAAEGVPTGDFDLSHLQAIHRHLFQDVYDWAGQVRTVELSKGDDQFMFRQYIHTGISDIHRRIVKADYFKGASQADFAAGAGRIIGDINYVHPFREGNGRTQLSLPEAIIDHFRPSNRSAPAWSGRVDGSVEKSASSRLRRHGGCDLRCS
jgi:cell filamentation protein